MGSNWTTAPLGDLLSYIGKGIVPIYTDDSVSDRAIKVLGQKCIRNQVVDYGQAKYHNNGLKPVKDTKLVQKNDILINSTGFGTAGRVAQVLEKPQHKCTTDGHVITLRTTQLDPIYLGYFIKSKQSYIEQLAEGSTGQTEINRDRLQNEIMVSFPKNINDQKQIVRFILNIDNLITLNTQLNDYLEELGRALLFEYNNATNKNAELGSFLSLGNGFAFKSSTYSDEGNYKILTIKNVQNGSVDCSDANRIDELPEKLKEYCLLKSGNVVLSLTGNVGRVGIVSEDNCLLNQRVAILMPHNEINLPGIYFLFRNQDFQNNLISIAKGTAQANLSPIETLKIKVPYESESFTQFSMRCAPLFKMILKNKQESLSLTNLREAILPQLMSGEIDVSQVNITQLNNHLSAS